MIPSNPVASGRILNPRDEIMLASALLCRPDGQCTSYGLRDVTLLHLPVFAEPRRQQGQARWAVSLLHLLQSSHSQNTIDMKSRTAKAPNPT